MDDQIATCIHCHNPVEKIEYAGKRPLTPGTVYNEYRHRKGSLRRYPICGVSPLMSEDIEWVNEEDM